MQRFLNAKAEEAIAGDLRIIPMENTFIVELTYRVDKDECKNSKSVSLNPNEALCCDLGIVYIRNYDSLFIAATNYLPSSNHNARS